MKCSLPSWRERVEFKTGQNQARRDRHLTSELVLAPVKVELNEQELALEIASRQRVVDNATERIGRDLKIGNR